MFVVNNGNAWSIKQILPLSPGRKSVLCVRIPLEHVCKGAQSDRLFNGFQELRRDEKGLEEE